MNIHPYALAWPDTQRRSMSRVKSSFRTGLEGAMKTVREGEVEGSMSDKPDLFLIVRLT